MRRTYTVKAKSLIYPDHYFEAKVEAESHGKALAKFESNHPTAYAVEIDGEKVH